MSLEGVLNPPYSNLWNVPHAGSTTTKDQITKNN